MDRWLRALAVAAAFLATSASSALADSAGGTAVLADTVVPSDTLVVALKGIVSPGAGSHYEGWLRSADGSERTDLGAIPVGSDGSVSYTYVSPRSENLIGANTVFEMTVEPDGSASSTPTGRLAYRGQLPDGIVPAVREALFRWPGSRFGTPAAEGLLQDARLLDTTSAQLLQAAQAGDLATAKRLAERLVNTVEGQNGAKYGDLNHDGQTEAPGDGTGALNYAWGTYWRARVVATADPGDDWVASHANAITASVEQLVTWAGLLRDGGLSYQSISEPDQAVKQAQVLREAASRVLNGFDANGDGTIDAAAGEGGAKQVLEQSQQLAAFRIGPAEPRGEPSVLLAVSRGGQ